MTTKENRMPTEIRSIVLLNSPLRPARLAAGERMTAAAASILRASSP